jgi:zinc protease
MSRTIDLIRRTERGPRPIPAIGDTEHLTVPPHVDKVLPTGLRVLCVQHPSAPTTHFTLHVPMAGRAAGHTSFTSVLAGSLFTGTRRRDRLQVDTDTARIGGAVTAVSDAECMRVTGSSLSPGLSTLLDVLFDALADATFPDDQVDVVRNQVLQATAMRLASPDTLAAAAFNVQLYGDHPATWVLPKPEMLAALTPQDIRDLHAASVVPEGSTLVMISDLDPETVFAEVARAAGAWDRAGTAQLLPALPSIVGGDLIVAGTPDAAQVRFRLGAEAVMFSDPQYAALQLATIILGGGPTSRLNLHLREGLELCYGVSANLGCVRHEDGVHGAITITLNTGTEKAPQALAALLEQLDLMVEQPPDAEELDRIRRFYMGSQLLTGVSQESLRGLLERTVPHGLGMDWPARERELIAQVSPDDIAAAARVFFPTQRYTGVVAGDPETLLNKFADNPFVRTS